MVKYTVHRTDKADELIHKMILGIAEKFGQEIAFQRLNELEKQIQLLAEYPDLGKSPRYMVLKRQGYKVLTTEKNLIFYKINAEKKIITVYAVLDQRQDYLHIIRGL